MTQSLRRKVVYMCAIAVLLVPLYFLSHPSTRNPDGQLTEGGLLARMRTEHGLSQARLGEIDPASESMKLATLGMRGIAANLLWQKAHDFKKTEDWDNLKATLNQIVKLQPNFISVWRFQAWNLSYNVSVEFDDYRHRYHWVRRGIEFMMEGTRYNRDQPKLLWDLGWFFGHKIGRADERLQYRRLFRDDEDFHATLPMNIDDTLGPDGKPDNWLVGRQWYRTAQNAVDIQGASLGRQNPVLFYSSAAMSEINHANSIEEEGILDEKAQYAWMRSGKSWEEFGNREILTSIGLHIRLNEAPFLVVEQEEMFDELEGIVPGIHAEIQSEKKQELSAEERQVIDTPIDQRSDEQKYIASGAERKIEVRPEEVLERATPENRRRVREIVSRIRQLTTRKQAIERLGEQVNFEYWKIRTAAEQRNEAIAARRNVFEADRAAKAADHETARHMYEKAWDQWSVILDEYPVLLVDITADELMEAVDRYRDLLGQLDVEFPPPGFKLHKLIAVNDSSYIPPSEVEIESDGEDSASDVDNNQEEINSGSGAPDDRSTDIPLDFGTSDTHVGESAEAHRERS